MVRGRFENFRFFMGNGMKNREVSEAFGSSFGSGSSSGSVQVPALSGLRTQASEKSKKRKIK